MVTINFGEYSGINMLNPGALGNLIFGDFPPFNFLTGEAEDDYLEIPNHADPDSATAFIDAYGHFSYDQDNGAPLPTSTVVAFRVYSAADVAADFETFRIDIDGFEVGFSAFESALLAEDIFQLFEGEELEILGSIGFGDTLVGGNLDDDIFGFGGNDTLRGMGGNDILDGMTGADTMVGGLGDDDYVVDNVLDRITERSGEGNDFVFSTVSYTLPAHVDTLVLDEDLEAINGTGNSIANGLLGNAFNNSLSGLGGNDILVGDAGNDTLNGGSGNDTLNGGPGNDTMIGGPGNDTYLRNATGDVVTEAANAGTDTVQSTVTNTLPVNTENLTLTGSANINGTGNTGNNVLTGNSGKNTLNGSSGNDTLNGGPGIDKLTGGAGADFYLFKSALGSTNIDQVTSYSVADDTIQLENAIFTSLTSTGTLSAANFRAGPGRTTAADGNDFILYNTSNGQLFYDAGGNTGAPSKLFATLVGAPAGLTAADFLIV